MLVDGGLVRFRDLDRQTDEEVHMGIGRASKIAAGIVFIVAALGVAAPVLLVPIGLAVWVLGESLLTGRLTRREIASMI